jgi:hypothetical protein
VLKLVHVPTASELLHVAARASAAAQLRHIRYAHLVDRGKEGDVVFTVREHAAKGSLAEHGQRLSTRSKLRVAAEVGAALDHLHRHGLAHGAVNPGNVLLGGSDESRLADVALGALFADAFTAPERRAKGALDGRTDQFSLAALTTWLLTGKPVPGHEPLSQHEPLDHALRRALDAVPERRFPHVDALTEAIVTASRVAGATPTGLKTNVERTGHLLRVSLTGRFMEGGLTSCVAELEGALRTPGPWAIAYVLEASGGCQSVAIDSLVAMHRRHRTHLRRVGFLTDRPEARGFGVLVGTAVEGLPWKVFGTEETMKAWLSETNA